MKKVKGKYIRLTESELKNIIKESVTNILVEYACERREFIEIAEGRALPLVIHWCLINYARLTDSCDENINHWKSELRNYMFQISSKKIKDIKSVEGRMKAIKTGFDKADLLTYQDVYDNIYAKFLDENIDMESELIQTVINNYLDNTDNIILLMAQGISKNVADYVYAL